MKYKIILSNEAKKNFSKIKGEYKDKIAIALKSLEDNPYRGKKMKGNYEDHYRLRAWPFRIVYRIEKRRLIIFVITIEQREGAYK